MFGVSLHVMLFTVSFLMTLIIGPLLIPILRKLKFGQTVRDDGPESHLVKMGTPTIGGLIFLIPIVLISIYCAKADMKILPVAFVTIGFGIIGFIDDYIKVVKKRKDGLYWDQKMLGLLIISTAFSFYVSGHGVGTDIIIPFLGVEYNIDLSWLFIPFSIIVLLATTNSVNITDGLDGLASTVTLIIMIFFAIVAGTNYTLDYIRNFSSIVAGGCLGFLAFNSYPANVFMGDTGSLALGGAVGSIAIMLKMPLILIIIGVIYVVESISVILQVAFFKIKGKRIFKMAPIHHHFELSGFKETTIVLIFSVITVVFCIIGFFALRLKII